MTWFNSATGGGGTHNNRFLLVWLPPSVHESEGCCGWSVGPGGISLHGKQWAPLAGTATTRTVSAVEKQKRKKGKTNGNDKAEPTRLGRVRAVDLGEGSRAGAALARVLLLAGAPPPVVELLAIRLLAPPEHAHRPAGLLHHVHDAVEHLVVGRRERESTQTARF